MIQTPEYMDLLPPTVLGRFSKLRLLARGFVEGFKSGDHRSPYIGSSTEFAAAALRVVIKIVPACSGDLTQTSF